MDAAILNEPFRSVRETYYYLPTLYLTRWCPMKPKMRLWQTLGSTAHIVGKSIGVAGYCGAGGVLVVQCGQWLHYGQWTSLSLMDSVSWIAPHLVEASAALAFQDWSGNPASWFGLHRVMVLLPTALALALVGLLGTMLSDWGIVTRRRAYEAIREARAVSSPRESVYQSSILDAEFKDFRAKATPPKISQHLDSLLAPVEQDILRWLAINDADQHANSLKLLARHLDYPPADFRHGVSKLADQDFITVSRGHLQLSERGRSYCIESSWTISMRRAG